jgi:hypothetical protein
MNTIKRRWGVVLFVVLLSGCPDGPPQILRDEMNASAEVADYLTKVTDEDSAREAVAVMDRLKDRWDAIKKRRENYIKMAEGLELLYFSHLQAPNKLVTMVKTHQKIPPEFADKIKDALKRMEEPVSLKYLEEMNACIERLKTDKVRVSGVPIADQMVQSNIQQFESKVFGSQLKIPDNPVKPDDKILISVWKIDWTAGGFPTLLLAIAGGILGGLGGVGVLFRLRR